MFHIPFYDHPAFWGTLIVLNCYWFAGLRSAVKNGMATPGQMLRQMTQGLPWIAHFGFWHLLLVLQPVLAYATAEMWPLWQDHAAELVLCVLVGQWIGYLLQSAWSRDAGSSDAWSKNGLPNDAGIIHIMHTGPEIGIILMLLISAMFYGMSFPLFFGVLAIVVNHLIIGTHWPLRILFPGWHPEKLKQLYKPYTICFVIVVSGALLFVGFRLLIVGTLLHH